MSVSHQRRAHLHCFTRSPFFALPGQTSAQIEPNMRPQCGQNATKTPSQTHLIFAPFLDLILFENASQNKPKNNTKARFGGLFISHVVPDVVLGHTFLHVWPTCGPPRFHFGFIELPF